MRPELKPCPCCGAQGRYSATRRRIGTVCPHIVYKVHVNCKKCGVRTASYGSDQRAAGKWNARV